MPRATWIVPPCTWFTRCLHTGKQKSKHVSFLNYDLLMDECTNQPRGHVAFTFANNHLMTNGQSHFAPLAVPGGPLTHKSRVFGKLIRRGKLRKPHSVSFGLLAVLWIRPQAIDLL
ncbi:UNVERIFIED_CONTAM: hypothetical protein K2H54_058552 [Gekko kuhli]